MKVVEEEIFGPVVCAMPFKDIDEVATQMNRTAYGLAGGIWTPDVSKAHRMARAMKAGTVWINCYNVFERSGTSFPNRTRPEGTPELTGSCWAKGGRWSTAL